MNNIFYKTTDTAKRVAPQEWEKYNRSVDDLNAADALIAKLCQYIEDMEKKP